MRTFDHVDNKLFESDFFIQKMKELTFEMFEMKCYFSAFVSSSRSVTFSLQASMNGHPGFRDWYADVQQNLREDELARFFNECRTDDQKIGFNNIRYGIGGAGRMLWFFGVPMDGNARHIPELDVVDACEKHMATICGVVDKTYSDFGIEIDPDQRYRPDGLTQLGMTIEDLEEHLGFPRGWTDFGEVENDKHLKRLDLLFREIPRSHVKPLLRQYLGRDLTYPVDRFRYP